MKASITRLCVAMALALALALSLALSLAVPGSAFAYTSNAALGELAGSPAANFTQAFNDATRFVGCWRFNLASGADVSGTTTEVNSDFWFLP